MLSSQNFNTQQPKRILILGAAGFLGINLIRHILQDSPDVQITAVDFLHPALKSNLGHLKDIMHKIEFIKGDIRDKKLLKQIVPNQHIIFNCAAQTSHPLSFEYPVFDTDVTCIGNLKLLMAIRDYSPDAVVVYPSSTTVVGKAIGDVIDENHSEKPLDIYSTNKGVAEKYYRVFNTTYNMKTVVLRFPNLFGPYGKTDPAFGFANYFIGLAADNKTIEIYGDGQQTRNIMFVDDACDILWQAAHNPKLIGESYFATHYDHYTVKEIAQTIVDVFDQGSIKYIPWPDLRKRIDVEKVMFSSARLHYLTNWRPQYSLRQGLELTKQKIYGK